MIATQPNSESSLIFERSNPFLGRVIQADDGLSFVFPAGADANHDPRTFSFQIQKNHLEIIRNSLQRHMLLLSALSTLADRAGTEGDFDKDTAIALLDPILLGTEAEVEMLFKKIDWNIGVLIASGANASLMEQGALFEGTTLVTEAMDWNRFWEYRAEKDLAERGVSLLELDREILQFTGLYPHKATIPSRRPDKTNPTLLPKILEIISTGEQVALQHDLPSWSTREYTSIQKDEWQQMETRIVEAVSGKYPELSSDAVRAISYLLCSEAVDRVRASQ